MNVKLPRKQFNTRLDFRGRHGLDSRIVLVPPHSLPQTSSGKLSRSRARTMYLAGVFPRAPVAEFAESGAE